MNLILLIPVLFPMLAGAIMPLLKLDKDRTMRQAYVLAVVIVNFILVLFSAFMGNAEFRGFHVAPGIDLLLKVDGVSRLFTILASVLWICASIYTFEYIKHEGKDVRFFSFFLMTIGILVGLGMAGNFFTLYLFYELMTVITYPLVIHSENDVSMEAGTKYLMYSFFGAAFALIGMGFMSYFGLQADFRAGGILDMTKAQGHEGLLLVVFFLTFLGFGCKAGMWPLHAWLPTAHPVAPAPASALLSGVITKGGVVALIRVTYYLFGVNFVRGTWAHTTLTIMALFTVFMGSMLAYKEKLFKRRLAYSSVSQVSYVVYGLTLMNPIGFLGAMLHIVCHAVIKNVLFLSAGAVIYKTGKTYVYELKGIGKRMPIVMWCFTLASLALVGIPPTAGVVSKWYLAMGGISSGHPILGKIGAGTLLISALLTGGYLITIFVSAFFPGNDFDYEHLESAEPNRYMTIPLVFLAILCVVIGMFPAPLINFFNGIASTIF